MGTNLPWLSIMGSIPESKDLRQLDFIYLMGVPWTITLCSCCNTHLLLQDLLSTKHLDRRITSGIHFYITNNKDVNLKQKVGQI